MYIQYTKIYLEIFRKFVVSAEIFDITNTRHNYKLPYDMAFFTKKEIALRNDVPTR